MCIRDRLNRNAFNSIIIQKVTDAINVAKAVIKQTEAKHLKIDKILLIGGSSQLTLVRQMLTDILPETTIDTCGEKDIAVALGNIAEEATNDTDCPKPPDIPPCEIDHNRFISCPSCGSKKCYHYVGKRGYHCFTCGYDGPNVKITIIR